MSCIHPEIADGRCRDCGVELAEIHIITVDEFAAVEEPGAEALVGDESNVVFPENCDAMFYGDGGAGKTTLGIDLAVHIAAGDDWLGIGIAQPRRVLLIENEGPRPLFRKKLARKAAGWQGSPLNDRMLVWESPWAEFTFADTEWRERLARYIGMREVDVVIVGPITAAGMDEAGTLQEARAFNRLIREVRQLAGRDVLVIVIHHENKGGKVSGAWEGVGDTLIHVQAQGHGRTRLYFQKARWASDYHATSLNLTWAAGEGFAVEEKDELDDEALADLIVAAISESPGSGWTQIAKATRGVGKDRRNAVRDGLLADGRIVNVDKDAGVINHLIEAKAAHLYRGDDPVVGQLRPDSAAVEPQSAADRGEGLGTATAACGSPIGAAGRSRSSDPPSEHDELDVLIDEVWRD